MKTIISRSSEIFRPLSLAGKQVFDIVFHDGEKQVYHTDQGWIQIYGVDGYSGDRDVVEIELSDIRCAHKIDLSKKDNFYVSAHRGYNNEKGIALYIYVGGDITITPAKEFLSLETETEKSYLYKHIIKGLKARYIKSTLKKGVKNGDGSKDYNFRTVEIDEFEVHTRGYHRQELTVLGTKVEDTTKAINEKCKLDISEYDIERILEHFDIVER